jgi:hypothetical protein
MRSRSVPTHALRAMARSSVIALLVVGLAAGTALAAKGGGKPAPNPSSGTLTLRMVTDQNHDGLPNWGDSITWSVSTTATTKPYVALTCRQGTTTVYSASAGYFAGYLWPDSKIMVLMSPVWSGGAADCTGTLFMTTTKGNKTLVTYPFHVSS